MAVNGKANFAAMIDSYKKGSFIQTEVKSVAITLISKSIAMATGT